MVIVLSIARAVLPPFQAALFNLAIPVCHRRFVWQRGIGVRRNSCRKSYRKPTKILPMPGKEAFACRGSLTALPMKSNHNLSGDKPGEAESLAGRASAERVDWQDRCRFFSTLSRPPKPGSGFGAASILLTFIFDDFVTGDDLDGGPQCRRHAAIFGL